MERLVLDTCVATLLLVKKPHPREVHRWNFTRHLLEEANYDFLLPAPVLAELLAAIPERKRDAALEVLRKMSVLSFDERAARECVRIWTKAPKDAPVVVVKYDAQIVGCALRWNVSALCSYDGQVCSRFKRLSGKPAGPPEDFVKTALLALMGPGMPQVGAAPVGSSGAS